MNTPSKYFVRSSVLLFIFLNIYLEAATVWDGGGGADTSIQNSANWSNGLPDLTNTGTVSGNFTVTYSTDSDFDDAELLFNTDGSGSPTVSGNALSLNGTRLTVDGDTAITVNGTLRGGQDINGGGAAIELTGDSIFTVTNLLLLGLVESTSILQSGNAVLNVEGGQFDVGNTTAAAGAAITAGSVPNSSIYTIDGGVLNVSSFLRARFNSEININGGEVNLGSSLIINEDSRLNITGGVINAATTIQLQASGGTGVISGGTINSAGLFAVSGGDSSLIVSGGDINAATNLNVTNGGTATLTGGTIDVANNLAIVSANSSITLDGADLTSRVLTLNDNGTLTTNSGLLTTTGAARVQSGSTFNQNSNVEIGGNLLLRPNPNTLSDLRGGVFNANMGDLTVRSNLNVDDNSIFNQNGSSVTVGTNLNLNDSGVYNANIGDLTVGNNLTLNDTSVFNQNGSNVIVDNNLNLLDTSTFVLDNGVLQVRADINVASTSTFEFNAGGILSVHDSASIIDYDGDLNATGGTLDLDAMTEHLDVSGTLDITNLTIDGYTLDLTRIGGIQEGSILLVNAGTLTGDLDNILFENFIVNLDGSQLSLEDPLTTTSDDFFYFDTSNNQIRLNFRIIPEPSSILLILLGSSFIALRRKRRD